MDPSTMNQEEQKELQQMVIELNIMDARFKEMQQQIQLIDQQVTELQIMENNITEIGKIKKDSETLSQVGQGIFVKSSIKDTKEVFVDIGSKIVLKKSSEEAKKLIKKRIDQVMNVRTLVIQELNKMMLNIQFLEKHIQEKANN
jgi:prefoldin alpha subunit